MVMDPSIAPPWTLRPDPATLASTRRMCSRLLQQPDLFATAFQDNFRASAPGGVPPQPSTCEAAAQLAESVVGSIVHETDPDQLESFWTSTGGVRAAHLPSLDLITTVVRSLVRSVRDVLGDEWSSATGSEWAAMQLWIVPHLTTGAGYARAAGYGPPAPVETSTTAPPPDRTWPAAPDGPDPASRHDRKRRGGVRRDADGDAWVP